MYNTNITAPKVIILQNRQKSKTFPQKTMKKADIGYVFTHISLNQGVINLILVVS